MCIFNFQMSFILNLKKKKKKNLSEGEKIFSIKIVIRSSIKQIKQPHIVELR